MNATRLKQPFLVRVAAVIGEALGAGKRGYISAQVSRFEGAERNRFRSRPSPLATSDDHELNFGQREDLMGEARILCATKGLCGNIIRKYAAYVVGTCQARWYTSDKTWNKLAESAFYNWSVNCDIETRNTLIDLAKKHVKGMLRDGDSFARKVDFFGDAKFQCYEADQVGNYNGGSRNFDEPRLVGGIGLDGYKRPTFYRTWERTPYGMFENKQDIPAAEMLHVYDPDRFSIRGVTHFASALNHFRDNKETVDAQKAKQKMQSKRALIIRNSIGGPDTTTVNVMTDAVDAKGSPLKLETVDDGQINYQVNGDAAEMFTSNDPGESWFKFCEMVIREASLALDLPYEFTWSMAGLPGPAVRMMSKQAERTFTNTRGILNTRFLNPGTAWWVNYEMDAGRLPFNPEWPLYRFQGPAHPSIDAGRDSKSNIEELGSGVSTECRIAEEQGEDDEEVAMTRLSESRRKLTNAKQLVSEFPEISLSEALDLIGRPNIPKTAALDATAQQEPVTANP